MDEAMRFILRYCLLNSQDTSPAHRHLGLLQNPLGDE